MTVRTSAKSPARFCIRVESQKAYADILLDHHLRSDDLNDATARC